MFSEIRSFVLRHWLHLLLAVPGLILVTWMHEAAHAGAVLLQGGQVIEFVWLPDSELWGHIRYDLPPDGYFAPLLVGLAPYLLWLFIALVAFLLSLRRKPCSFWAASSIFFWLYLVPLADIGNTTFPYLRGGSNDFAYIFPPPTPLIWGMFALAVLIAAALGYGVQRRLYGEYVLSLRAYLVLAVITLLGLAFAVGWLFDGMTWLVYFVTG